MSDTQLTPEELSEAAVSAPGIVSVGNHDFLVSKPTDADAFEIYWYAKQQATAAFNPVKEVIESMRGLDLPAEYRAELLQTAARLTAQHALGEEDITAWLISPLGVAYRLWVLSRCNQPSSLRQCEQLVNTDNYLVVFAQIDAASGSNLLRKAFGGPPNPFAIGSPNYCRGPRHDFYRQVMEVFHFTPRQVAKEFSILQLIALFYQDSEAHAEMLKTAKSNSEIIEEFLKELTDGK